MDHDQNALQKKSSKLDEVNDRRNSIHFDNRKSKFGSIHEII